MPSQTGYSSVKNTTQDIQNLGLDREFNVPFREVFVHNPVTDQLDRMVQPGNELPTAGNNGQIALGYTGENLTTITKTINGVQYQKTLTYTGSVLDSISSWVQL